MVKAPVTSVFRRSRSYLTGFRESRQSCSSVSNTFAPSRPRDFVSESLPRNKTNKKSVDLLFHQEVFLSLAYRASVDCLRGGYLPINNTHKKAAWHLVLSACYRLPLDTPCVVCEGVLSDFVPACVHLNEFISMIPYIVSFSVVVVCACSSIVATAHRPHGFFLCLSFYVVFEKC